MKKWMLMIFLITSSVCVNAEDGIALKFTIKKRSVTTGYDTTHSTDVLQRRGESAKYNINDMYEIKLYTRSISESESNLTVTLKDLSGEKPSYIGAKSFDIKVGTSSSFQFAKRGYVYAVHVDTYFDDLPK